MNWSFTENWGPALFNAVGLSGPLLEKYGPRFLDGLLVTMQLVGISLLAGLALAIPLALMRLSSNRYVSGFAFGYSYFFRGTPLLVQTFLVYHGAGQFRLELDAVGLWWIFREAYVCALMTFTLNTAAYQSEIIRGAIKAIPSGQIEAALSLGMKRPWIFARVIAPQAALIALRPYGNEVILMIKGSAVASVVTVHDLMGAAETAFARSYNFEVWLWAAVMYLILVETVRRVWDVLEDRMTRHLRPVGKAAQAAPGMPKAVPVRT